MVRSTEGKGDRVGTLRSRVVHLESDADQATTGDFGVTLLRAAASLCDADATPEPPCYTFRRIVHWFQPTPGWRRPMP